jgi:serine/threonine protein kinase
MRQYTKVTNATRLSAPSLSASHVVPARRSIPDASWAPNQFVPGTEYRIVRPLGEGGMGQVFEVEDEGTGRRFALKAIHRTLCLREDLAQRFRQEARVLGRLHEHPNVVEIVATGESKDKRVYLVMGLLKGCSLEHELTAQRDERPAPFEELVPWACGVTQQVLAALRAVHAEGIFHRDVKPANVFLLARGGVKLLDFGIAGFLMPRPGSKVQTEPGQVTGTPGYMPPERLEGRTADARTDVFATGVMLWEMLARERAVPDHDPHAASSRVAQEGIPPLGSKRGLARHLPPALIAVVDQATAHDANQRFASAEAFAEALRAAIVGFDEPANVGPLRGLKTAPVPVTPDDLTEPTGAPGAPTREVRFGLTTPPNGQAAGESSAFGVPSSVDPFAGTPPVGVALAAGPWAASSAGWGPQAERLPQTGSREHDWAYRESPTISARVGEVAALVAEESQASAGPPLSERQGPSSSRARKVMLRGGLLLALGAFGLGLASQGWRRSAATTETTTAYALPAAPTGEPEEAARNNAAATAEPAPPAAAAAALGATPAAAPAATAAVPAAAAALGASPEANPAATAAVPAEAAAVPAAAAAVPAAAAAVPVAAAAVPVAAAAVPAATAAAPAAAAALGASPAAAPAATAALAAGPAAVPAATAALAAGPAGAPAAAATGPSASALALKAAGVREARAGTDKGAPTAGNAAPRGAAAGTTPGGAARGVRKVRAEGARPPMPGEPGWRLKRVIKVEL